MELLLVRHGESQDNANVSRSKDSMLTPLGEEQAFRTGQALKGMGIDRLFCSAQMRALQTATIISGRIGVPPEVIVNLSERNFCWEESGLPRSVMTQRFPAAKLPPEVDEEGWARHCSRETFEQLDARVSGVAQAIRDWAADAPEARIAMIIHQGSGSRILRNLLGVSPAAESYFRHHNCGISQLFVEADKIILNKLNDCAHLSSR